MEECANNGGAGDDWDGVGGLVERGKNSKAGQHDGVGTSNGGGDNGGWFHHHDGKTSEKDADDGADGKSGHIGAKLFDSNDDSKGETDATDAELFDRKANEREKKAASDRKEPMPEVLIANVRDKV